MPRYQGDPHWITIRFSTKCNACEAPLAKGARAYYFPQLRRMYGETCCQKAKQADSNFAAAAFDDDVMGGQH